MNSETQASSEIEVQIRFGLMNDMGFVVDSWLRSYRKRSPAVKLTPDVYFDGQRAVIADLLERSRILVACDPRANDEIWGFVVFEPSKPLAFHYIYVKSVLRRFGLAKRLFVAAVEMAPATIQHSHETDIGSVLAKKYGSTWNPYLAR